ncbi:MAG: CsbD family protein [Acidimicrobiales bacterium]|nr:CsbD family protein [Acidimicrobiales bacterium]MCB1040418.1 CsbD family protein [Acidimicrobiales bacterium]HRW39197.1 CsbD family protein [Aquihabitans sp.]
MSNADDLKGRAKEAAGDLTDDDDLKREGKADQVTGKVKEGIDKVKDKLTGND